MNRITRFGAAVALVAAFAVSPLVSTAHADSVGVKTGPGATHMTPADIPLSASGWYTDGGGSGSGFPYHPGFHPVPAPPPMPMAY